MSLNGEPDDLSLCRRERAGKEDLESNLVGGVQNE